MKGMNKFYWQLGWKSFYPNVSRTYNVVGAISFLGGIGCIVQGILDKDSLNLGLGGTSTLFGYQMLFNKSKITKLPYIDESGLEKKSKDYNLPPESLLLP